MRRTTIRLGLAGLALTVAATATGIALARANAPVPPAQANAFGSGATPRPVQIAASQSARGISPVADSLLTAAQATASARVAVVGRGAGAATLFAVKQPSGEICFSVAHAGGNIVEPLNCHSDAYMRVWSDASGSGVTDIAQSVSQHVIAVVSQEVLAVRVTFADGSSKLAYPTAVGVISASTAGGASRVTQLEALGAGDSVLAAANV
jgi:hypothetical protein